MNRIKLIIFDMDGVIFDSERLSKELYPEICKKYGYNVSKEMIDMTLGLTYEDTCKFYKHILSVDFPYETTAKDLENQLITLAKKKQIPIKPGIVELLEYFKTKKYLIAIASSNNKASVMAYIDNSNLVGYFNLILTGNDVFQGKPSPEIFIKAANFLNIDVKDCIVIEDSKNGLIAGKKAGMITFMVPDLLPYDNNIKEYVDYHFEDYYSMLNHIKEKNYKNI